MTTAPLLRSLLYAPGNRPDLVAKMERFAPDAVIIDLEDGTPPSAKAESRATARQAATDLAERFGGTIWLRINAPASEWFEHDLTAFDPSVFRGVVVPKVEEPSQVERVEAALDGSDAGVMWGFETVAGVVRARDILDAGRSGVAVYFGAEDYVADLGGRRTRDSLETLVPRSQVAIAARMAGLVAIDQVVLDLSDDDHFRRDAQAGIDLGYRGKNCIHPSQVALCREVYTPTQAMVDRARRLLDCHAEALEQNHGTANFEGQMIDTPLVIQARVMIDQADAAMEPQDPAKRP